MQAELQVAGVVMYGGTINISGCHSTGNMGGGGYYAGQYAGGIAGGR